MSFDIAIAKTIGDRRIDLRIETDDPVVAIVAVGVSVRVQLALAWSWWKLSFSPSPSGLWRGDRSRTESGEARYAISFAETPPMEVILTTSRAPNQPPLTKYERERLPELSR